MVVYSGPFSVISIESDRSLLNFSWNVESRNLDEKGVKFEIGRILDYVRQYDISNIIVDTTHYHFLNNVRIQDWINRSYMPAIMETGVKKYALVVASEVKDKYPEFEDVEIVLPLVEYFADVEKARKWIEL